MNIIDCKHRINWIDWAKSTCMFLVILGHCHIQQSESNIIYFIYSFHMPFFFFISGVLCNRNLSYKSLKKDLKYIVIPYLSFCLMTIMWSIILSRTIDIETCYLHIQSTLLGTKVIGPFWFLLAIFICKQLFIVIKSLKDKHFGLYYIICILSFFPTYFFSNNYINLPLFSDSAICGLPFFILGNELISFICIIGNYRKTTRLLIATILLCISVTISINNGHVDISECIIEGNVIAYYIASLSAIFSILIVCTLANQIKNTFTIVTSYGSIVTLGIHRFILYILESFNPLFFGKLPYSYPLYIALIISLTTYLICFILILIFDTFCPLPFGLRGQVKSVLHNDVFADMRSNT